MDESQVKEFIRAGLTLQGKDGELVLKFHDEELSRVRVGYGIRVPRPTAEEVSDDF
jgi:hypothetical protein